LGIRLNNSNFSGASIRIDPTHLRGATQGGVQGGGARRIKKGQISLSPAKGGHTLRPACGRELSRG